jgi:hypothetical protein
VFPAKVEVYQLMVFGGHFGACSDFKLDFVLPQPKHVSVVIVKFTMDQFGIPGVLVVECSEEGIGVLRGGGSPQSVLSIEIVDSRGHFTFLFTIILIETNFGIYFIVRE